MPQFLNALIWLFSFWVVADSIRRRTGLLWVILILWFRPWGGLVYLLILKLSEGKQGQPLVGRISLMPPKIISRAEASRTSPGTTAENSSSAGASDSSAGDPALDVADQLELQERYREAAAVYRKAIAKRPTNSRALHGLARSLVELGQGEEALDSFATLMECDPRFRDYAAALEYAEALHLCQRTSDAIGLLNGLVSETERINHRLAQAHYLSANGERERACGVLREALQQYEGSSEADRIAMSQWHRRIVDMLEDLSVS